MIPKLFVAIDFDGTITAKDITDAVIQRFARPGWEAAEEDWEKGLIGSKKCLEIQMGLIDEPLSRLLDFVDNFAIDKTFLDFAAFLRKHNIPHAVVSDGFGEFSRRILRNAGLADIPVYANSLKEEGGKLKTFFPNSREGCHAGTCKCLVTDNIANNAPVILVGDGRSDFGLAGKATFVFSKGKLTDYCKANGITHHPFENFNDVERYMAVLLNHASRSTASMHNAESIQERIKI